MKYKVENYKPNKRAPIDHCGYAVKSDRGAMAIFLFGHVYNPELSAEVLCEKLNRLAKIEEVVAWKGFDELPESDLYDIFTIDVKDRFGHVYQASYDKRSALFLSCGEHTVDAMKARKFKGWRYPVGDLG